MANDAEAFSRPNAEALIHDLEQYTLWTDTPGRPNYRARMTFGERNGAPRITVFTNLEDGPAVIVAGFEPRIFEQFLNEFEEGLRADKPFTIKIENMAADPNARPEKGTPRDAIPKVLKNTLVFGRNSDGIAFIGLTQANVPNIAFRILPSTWHNFRYADGQEVDQGELSRRQAIALVGSVRRAMDRWTARLRTPWTPDPSKRKGANAVNSSPASTFDSSSDIGF